MFLLVFAAAYYLLPHGSHHGLLRALVALKTGNENYGLYAMVFACIYFLHPSRMLKLIYCSIRECQLAFKRKKKVTIKHVQARESKRSTASYRKQVTGLLRLIKQIWRALFSQEGSFGVESQHFLKVYVLREFLELSSQTYQAYQYSRCLPRVWLNTLLVSMLLINCWSTLVVQHFLGKKPALERVVAISVDAAISIAMCAIVPCLLVAPYANAMDTANSSFKEPDQLYDPVFITRLVLEFQLTFALSLTLCGQSDPSSRSLHVDRSIGSLLTRPTQHAASVAKTIETPERFD